MNVLGAIKKLYNRVNSHDVIEDIASDRLTENTCRNGRTVLWYMDENEDVAIYTDTLDFLTPEEVENELC